MEARLLQDLEGDVRMTRETPKVARSDRDVQRQRFDPGDAVSRTAQELQAERRTYIERVDQAKRPE